MNVSTFARAVLLGTAVCRMGPAQRAMTHVCRTLTLLNGLDIPEADELREELNELCRALSS